jgi:hypothetical protein
MRRWGGRLGMWGNRILDAVPACSSWPEFEYTLGVGAASTTDPGVKSRRRKHPIGFAAPAKKKPPPRPKKPRGY